MSEEKNPYRAPQSQEQATTEPRGNGKWRFVPVLAVLAMLITCAILVLAIIG